MPRKLENSRTTALFEARPVLRYRAYLTRRRCVLGGDLCANSEQLKGQGTVQKVLHQQLCNVRKPREVIQSKGLKQHIKFADAKRILKPGRF